MPPPETSNMYKPGLMVWPVRRGRERLDLRAHARRIGIRPRQGPTAWPPDRCAGKVAAGWQRGRDPRSPPKAGLEGVHRQDCRRHAPHHLPLYQDKAVTPTSLKDIFTPIWSGPLEGNMSTRARPSSSVLVQILLSVCFCRANDFPDFRPPRPWPTFPERWLLFRLVV
jgi:hypothetical protein